MKTLERTRTEMIQDMSTKAVGILTKLGGVEAELKGKPVDADIKRAYLEGLSLRWLRIASSWDFPNWNAVSKRVEELEAFVMDLEKAIKKPLVQNALSLLTQLLEVLKVEQVQQGVGWADACLEMAQRAEIETMIDGLKQALTQAGKLGDGPRRHLNIGVDTQVKEFSTKIANVLNLSGWITEVVVGIEVACQAQEQLDKAIAIWRAKESVDPFFEEVLKALNAVRNRWDEKDFDSGTALSFIVSHFRNVGEEARYLEEASSGLISAFEGWLGLLSEKARVLLAAVAYEALSGVAQYQALVERIQSLGQESSDVLKWERPIAQTFSSPIGEPSLLQLVSWDDVLTEVDPEYRPSFNEAFKDVHEALQAVHTQSKWKGYYQAVSDLGKHFDNSRSMVYRDFQSEAQRYNKFRNIDRISALLQELGELVSRMDAHVETLLDLASYWTSGTLLLHGIKDILKEDLSEPEQKVLDIVDKLRRSGIVSFRGLVDEARRAGLSPAKLANAMVSLEDRGISIICFE